MTFYETGIKHINDRNDILSQQSESKDLRIFVTFMGSGSA